MRINSLSPVNANYGMDASQNYQTGSNVQSASEVGAAVMAHVPMSVANRQDQYEIEQLEEIDEDMLNQSIQQANKNLESYNRVVERSVHDVTKTVMYTVRNTVTNEVIAEFPPKRIQDMIAKMWELAGLFVDEQA